MTAGAVPGGALHQVIMTSGHAAPTQHCKSTAHQPSAALASSRKGQPLPGLYPDICFRVGSMKLSEGGRSSGRRPRVEARSAEWRRGLGRGCPPPQYIWGSGGVTPGKILKLEPQFGAIWSPAAKRILTHFRPKFAPI